MKKIPYAISLIALAISIGYGQVQPAAAKRHLDKEEFVLLMADAGSRSLDVYSTHQMLQNGGHEMFLPGFVVNHESVMVTYSAGVVVVDGLIAHRLEKHGHVRLAHIFTMVDASQNLPWAIHNLYITKQKGGVAGFQPPPTRPDGL